jgi:hypothetical protein
MELIKTPTASDEPAGREMTFTERVISRIKYWAIRQRRKLPYLVWWNDELDVGVCLSQDKLNPEAGLAQLHNGAFYEAEKIFREMGIDFDTGLGPDGRDWEWDWSLKGPISVRFHGRAKCPHLRMEHPKPRLLVVHS